MCLDVRRSMALVTLTFNWRCPLFRKCRPAQQCVAFLTFSARKSKYANLLDPTTELTSRGSQAVIGGLSVRLSQAA